MLKIVNLIIIFQLSLVFQIQNVHAGVGDKFQSKAKEMILKNACDKGTFGCTLLDQTINDPDFLQEVVNMILIFTLTLSLLDSKCEVTPAGKQLEPKSYTAGITHWIHKIAGLIYIYAEIQNIITLRKLDKEYAEKAKVDGQLNKLEALREIMIAKKDATEKKLEVLKLSKIGFGASAAIDVGMSAAMGAWGGYKQSSEAKKCIQSGASLTSCAAKGGSSTANATSVEASIEDGANACISKFESIFTTKTLINTAKSKVVGTVVNGVTTVVGGVISKNITKAAGGNKMAQIAGGATGAYLINQMKLGDKVASAITDNITSLKRDGDGITEIIEGEPKLCIKEQVDQIVEERAKSVASSLAVDICVNVDCGASISANCAIQTLIQKDECVCMVRNTAQVVPALDKIISNLNFSENLIEDEKLLETMSTDAKKDEFLVEVYNKGQSDNNKKSKIDSDICGIDYINWVIRHDLECRPRFDFVNIQETKDKDLKTIGDESSNKKTTYSPYEKFIQDNARDTFISESEKLSSIMELDLDSLSFDLGTENADRAAKKLFNQEKLRTEYDLLDRSQKEKVHSALIVLVDAMKSIKMNMIINNAYAEDKKEFDVDKELDKSKKFASVTNEVTALTGLGLGVVGAFLFPEFIRKGIQLTTVLQRNPMRRGLFYLATYFMADENIKTTKNKNKSAIKNIEILDKMIEEERGQVVFSIPHKWNNPFEHFIKEASANVFDNSMVPLCISGTKFSTSCTCAKKGSCGNFVTNVKLQSELFKGIPDLTKMTSVQLSFINKMKSGKVNSNDYISLGNTMKSFENTLNPITAAENLDLSFMEANFPKPELVLRSKRLVASLQKSGFEKIETLSGKKLDLDQLMKNTDADFQSSIDNKASVSKTNKSVVDSKIDTVTPINSKKNQDELDKLDNYNVKLDDINENKDLDLFKIIKNRYIKTFYTK